MPYISIDPLLMAVDLAEAGNKVPQADKDILLITMGEHTITAREQFETFGLNVPLIYTSKNIQHAERMFLMLFHEQKLLLQKIKNQQEVIDNLANFDIGCDSTDLEYTNKVQGHTENQTKIKSESHGEQSLRGETNNDTTNRIKTDALNKTGASDNNSQTADTSSFIAEVEASTIPIASMSQVRAISDNATTLRANVVNNSKNESLNQLNSATNNLGKSDQHYEYKSSTKVSNASKDYIDYLKLNIDTDFRRQFGGAFRDIFATQ